VTARRITPQRQRRYPHRPMSHDVPLGRFIVTQVEITDRPLWALSMQLQSTGKFEVQAIRRLFVEGIPPTVVVTEAKR
jgi:hypothetical protein